MVIIHSALSFKALTLKHFASTKQVKDKSSKTSEILETLKVIKLTVVTVAGAKFIERTEESLSVEREWIASCGHHR